MPIAGKQVRWEIQWKTDGETESLSPRVQTLPKLVVFLAHGGFICLGYDDSSASPPVLGTLAAIPDRTGIRSTYTSRGSQLLHRRLPLLTSFFASCLFHSFLRYQLVSYLLGFSSPPPYPSLVPSSRSPHSTIHTIIILLDSYIEPSFFSILVLDISLSYILVYCFRVSLPPGAPIFFVLTTGIDPTLPSPLVIYPFLLG